MKKCVTLLLAAVLAVGSAFSSQAGSAFKKEVPLTLHMVINNRQTPIYDGYTSYIMGNRASEKDTFTVTKNSDTLNLDDVTLSYYLVTYNGGTEKNLECRVYGLKEGEHYPVVRPETFSRESEKGDVYDSLERFNICHLRKRCILIHNANIDMIPVGLMEIPQDLLGVFRLSRQEQMAYDHPPLHQPGVGIHDRI